MRNALAHVEEPGYKISVSTDGSRSPRYAYVEVRFPDGRDWAAKLYTPESVQVILEEWRRRGERRGELAGLYFWAPGVIMVREITRDGVVALVDDLITEGELESAFAPPG